MAALEFTPRTAEEQVYRLAVNARSKDVAKQRFTTRWRTLAPPARVAANTAVHKARAYTVEFAQFTLWITFVKQLQDREHGVETDARFYRRRACEEFEGASRAITEAGRQRRLQLAETFLAHLEALGEPCPPELVEVQTMLRKKAASGRSAFAWQPRTKQDES